MNDSILMEKYITLFLVISGYWVVSIFTVFVNKLLLDDIELNAPLFVTFFQTVVTGIICYTKKLLAKNYPNKFQFPETNLWKYNSIKSILPLSLMFTSMIATNNLCLKYVSVAFYYVGRSLTTIFNVTLTYLILGEKTSKKCIMFCFIIIFGFFLGVDQENIAGSLSVKGTIFGILGSLTLSLYSIFTKKVLPKVDNDIWALSYYNNIYSSILFIPLIYLTGEYSEVIQFKKLYEGYFWLLLIIGGICGFSIGFFTSLEIKYTSALTHNISGTAKACVQTILATYWYQQSKSVLWWCSNFIVLLGSAGYARMRQLDMSNRLYQKV